VIDVPPFKSTRLFPQPLLTNGKIGMVLSSVECAVVDERYRRSADGRDVTTDGLVGIRVGGRDGEEGDGEEGDDGWRDHGREWGWGVVLRVLRVLRGVWWKWLEGNGSFTQAAAFIDAQQFAKGAKGYKQ
jgi:hypothetical protein